MAQLEICLGEAVHQISVTKGPRKTLKKLKGSTVQMGEAVHTSTIAHTDYTKPGLIEEWHVIWNPIWSLPKGMSDTPQLWKRYSVLMNSLALIQSASLHLAQIQHFAWIPFPQWSTVVVTSCWALQLVSRLHLWLMPGQSGDYVIVSSF